MRRPLLLLTAVPLFPLAPLAGRQAGPPVTAPHAAPGCAPRDGRLVRGGADPRDCTAADFTNSIDVTTPAELRAALAGAACGTRIVVGAGGYAGDYRLARDCAPERPILVHARDVATLRGGTFTLDGRGLVLAGMTFEAAAIRFDGRENRVTRNMVRGATRAAIGGHGAYQLIDRNEVDRTDGVGIEVEVRRDASRNYGNRIERNHVHHQQGTGNGHEGIRVLTDGYRMSGAIVADNLLERVDVPGEGEAISIKVRGATIRGNTLVDSPASGFTNRNGSDNLFERNWIERSRGITVFGDRNVIRQNTVRGGEIRVHAGNATEDVRACPQFPKPTLADCTGAHPAARDAAVIDNAADRVVVGYQYPRHAVAAERTRVMRSGPVELRHQTGATVEDGAPRGEPARQLTRADVGPLAPESAPTPVPPPPVAAAAVAAPLLAPTAVRATPRPSTAALKQEVLREVASLQKLSQVMVDMVFSFSELGFQETRTADYVTGVLRKEGFRIERGCAGMPTCYVASWGSGAPVLGIMGDVDGLPESSQRPGVAYRDPLVPGGPGHGEGHNASPSVDAVAAIALKRVMQRHNLPGTVRVIPGVAEELGSSRTHMVLAGMFRDMDAMLSDHVNTETSTSWGVRATAIISTQYNFHGRTGHAAAAPWAGRSALDAAVLMDVAWNFRREHLRLQQRSHSVIVSGGSQPNVVPSEAVAWYYFRERDYAHVRELHAIGDTIAAAAAAMSSTRWDQRILGSSWEQTYNRPMAEAMQANIVAVGMPAWSEADQQLARAAQRMMGNASPPGLPTRVRELREDTQESAAASDDIGEVTWNVPTVRLRYAANIPGMTGHHWSSAIAMATPIAHKGANHASRIMAMTAVDLLTDPALLARTKAYFRDVQTRDRQWKSLIPTGTRPPVDLNRETMARFRPALDRLRYDPAKYASYLEQLGVRYPTLERREP